MSTAEEKLLDQAIKGTEEEIFGAAFGQDGTVDQADDDADKSLEEMEDDQSDTTAGGEKDASDDDADADDQDADGEADGEGEQGKKPGAEQSRDDKGKFADKDAKSETGDQRGEKPHKGDPTVPLRAERQRAAKLQEELETERRERAAERDTLRTDFAKLEGRLDQVLKGQTAQHGKSDTKSEVTDAEPDIFTNYDDWKAWNNRQIETRVAAVRQDFQNQRLETSFEAANEKHGKAFEAAYGALSSLKPENPAHVAIVNSIRSAPNPGARLMQWHRQQETLRKVGEDPDAFVASEVERALQEKLADPEFLKSLIAKAGGGAGDKGGQQQRGNIHVIRNPRSLNSEGGRAQSANDTAALDGSEQAVFAAAWK